ncbi:hypothetical protein IC620_07730 [Hazenella sp. IB182357]|uniref:Sugar-binding domain-containing protein n=1 Tax=Polycladospora coralii TaxID=2771432 RepID=A0A926NA48_9BACL|nr:sugar-binding domain-containing protein [Polycladospora coralii]MBD1372252.1 hypothetical protein [Polycladospora coralii]MBS7530751.1 hypothetical protein [Polycladospora coralii]
MVSILNIQKQLIPDFLRVMRKRYEILHLVQLMQPVGRRSLSATLQTTERILRSEIDFLRAQGLVKVDSTGIRLSSNGTDLIVSMEPMIKTLFGLSQLEEEISSFLGVDQVFIVPGDVDRSNLVKKDMGRAAARILKQRSVEKQIVAVSGGSSVLAVAENMVSTQVLKQTTFIPTRGGVGEAVELEANYIASLMAKQTGGSYRLLHIPDELSEGAYHTLIQEPYIRQVLDDLKQAKIVIHGIGDAKSMAMRRQSSSDIIRKLEDAKAVGESFGYYFDVHGQIVHRVSTVGLRLEEVYQAKHVIAVAGGKSKAAAITAVCTKMKPQVLVTDETAARFILDKYQKNEE